MSSSEDAPPSPGSASSSEPAQVSQPDASTDAAPAPASDSASLLDKARAFLQQPQIQHEDPVAKRKFLVDKGLGASEIDRLMKEPLVRRPTVPPRSYPQPPPSPLPMLLLGLARIFSWIAGGSVVLTFIYYRFLLPRVIETFKARGALKSHQLDLMRKLNTSLTSLKESQAQTAAILPPPQSSQEPPALAACGTLEALLKAAKDLGPQTPLSEFPNVSLLRCAISDYQGSDQTREPTTVEVFRVMEGKLPWLLLEEGVPFEQQLWNTLSGTACFVSSPVSASEREGTVNWKYVAPEPAPPTALSQSLSVLHASIPKPASEKKSAMQHALNSMTDLTGYISSQIYAPYMSVGGRMGPGATLPPAEEELRKEIRTLKGLILNRRTFLLAPARTQ